MQKSGILVLSAVALSVIATPRPALAWGEEGHLAICEIAYRNLTDFANSAVDDLLIDKGKPIHFDAKRQGNDATDARDYKVFNLGCLEEDTRPRKHISQHFINVARNTPAIAGDTCPPRKPGDNSPTDCILNGIREQFEILHNPKKTQRERVEALMGLGHWVGDIHQPLHVSFGDDGGGNGIKVRLVPAGPGRAKCGTSGERPSNLHAVWDGCLLQAGLFERVRQREDYKKAAAEGHPWHRNSVIFPAATALKDRTTLAEEQAWAGTEPWQWAQESYSKTIDPAILYCVKVGDECRYSTTLATLPKGAAQAAAMKTVDIDQAYIDANAPFAEERVRMAGHRLAHLINLALDPTYRGPESNRK